MDVPELEPVAESPPRTLLVLALLAVAALVFSYLVAYAGAGALIAADVLPPLPAGRDPRPGWLATMFGALMAIFGIGAVIARLAGSRQLRRIDAMSDDAACDINRSGR